ncbi:MAG TPA: nucleoside hydrolase [Chthoniobacterales bacterium]|nr:nucleoside hydrolase [Chthoniobacterales bacterium]
MANTANATTVWIDTDVSIGSPFREVDDAFALLLAFRCPELQIAGVSTSYGNAPLRMTTASARKLFAQLNPETPVFPGAASRNDVATRTEASEALAAALRRKGALTYVALGPLTNLAAFQTLHPALSRKIDRVIFLGGTTPATTLRFGSRHPIRIHDANVVKDPEAVERILCRGKPFTLIPVETAAKLTRNAAELDSLRRDPAGDFVQAHSRVWLWFWTKFVGTSGAPIFDAAAILAAADPASMKMAKRFAEINAVGELVVSNDPRGHSVSLAVEVRQRGYALLERRLGAR